MIYEQPKTHSAVPQDAPVVLEVKSLRSPAVKDVSFTLRRGEILGLAGLMGAGRTEVGAPDLRRGSAGPAARSSSAGKKVHDRHAQRRGARAASAICPRTASATACVSGFRWQTTPPCANLDALSSGAVVMRPSASKKTGREIRAQLTRSRPRPCTQLVRDLSGGNQQKVVIGQMAGARLRHSDLRRADPRHRRGREKRDLQADERSGCVRANPSS